MIITIPIYINVLKHVLLPLSKFTDNIVVTRTVWYLNSMVRFYLNDNPRKIHAEGFTWSRTSWHGDPSHTMIIKEFHQVGNWDKCWTKHYSKIFNWGMYKLHEIVLIGGKHIRQVISEKKKLLITEFPHTKRRSA